MTLWEELAAPWRACLEEAWSAFRAGSLPIGAVVVDVEGTIVGRGRNRIFETLADASDAACLFGHRLAHAEVNALVSVNHAAVSARDCVLYTTLEPCALCVGAIRMLALKDVRYAARDPAAGSLTLLDATEFMRRGRVQAHHLGRAELESVLVAMNVVAHFSLAERFQSHPPLDSWAEARLPGFDFGRALFASGDLQRLASLHTSVEPVLEELLSLQHAHRVPTGQYSPPARKPLDKQPALLIVQGPPASGKSTLGRQIAQTLRLPFLSKDVFKEALFDQLGWSDREWSQRVGIASMELLFGQRSHCWKRGNHWCSRAH